MRSNFGGRWSWRVDSKALVAVMVGLLVAFAPIYATTEGAVFAPNMDLWVHGEIPNTTIEIRTYVGEELDVSGAVTVGPGENLTLVDTHLRFTGPDEGKRGLWIEEGGTLVMVNSTFRRFGFHEKFAFEVHGSATILDSNVTYTSNGRDGFEGNRGLVILNDNVSVTNTTFEGLFTSAILVTKASPVIRNCTFQSIEDRGIVGIQAEFGVVGCHFQEVYYPIVLWQSEAEVSSCDFLRVDYGVTLWQGEVDVRDCVFNNTTRSVFLESPESSLRTQNISMVDGDNWSRNYPLFYSQKETCLLTTIATGIMGMFILVSANRHRPAAGG
jgi:hypothetical protein